MRRAAVLASQQHPLVATDEYYGEPLFSAVLQESDYAPYKPHCDLIFNHAVAHSPGGEPRPRWAVGVKVGEWSKRLGVTGPRQLRREGKSWFLTDPQPVSRVPIRYELAWGGTCRWPESTVEAPDAESQILAYEPGNPIGCGFLDAQWDELAQPTVRSAPQIESFEHPIDDPAALTSDYPVVGLGVVGRWWQPRRMLAGTYDEEWKKSRWPGLPEDFDFQYWNAAPTDQQIDYPQGGERVVLAGLHPSGEVRFRLPRLQLKLLLHLEAGVPLFKPLVTDTIIFDFQTYELALVQRAVVAARAGVDGIELGTWDIDAARRANAAVQGK